MPSMFRRAYIWTTSLFVSLWPLCHAVYWLIMSRGGDIHVAVDASFSHRHLRRAGDTPTFFEPSYILPKAFVDAVGVRIEKLRKKSPKHTYVPKLPDNIVDLCASGLVAADPSKAKTDNSIFDDTALAALVCRHEIPLFVANIDTPGEQQKYAIALVEHLFSFLPPNATVTVFYDIGCVLDRSVNQVCLRSLYHRIYLEIYRFSTLYCHHTSPIDWGGRLLQCIHIRTNGRVNYIMDRVFSRGFPLHAENVWNASGRRCGLSSQ